MPIIKTKIWTVGDVECREYRYSSGLLEIGFYTPSFVPDSNRIARCVVDRHGKDNPWFAHLPSTGARGNKHRTRLAAVAQAINAAQKAHDEAVASLAEPTARRAA